MVGLFVLILIWRAIQWVIIPFVLFAVIAIPIAIPFSIWSRHKKKSIKRPLVERYSDEEREKARLQHEQCIEYHHVLDEPEDSDIQIIDGWSKEERGTKFQELIALYFEGRGCKVKRMPFSGDYGADLLVTNPKTNKTCAVQCKCYNPNRKVSLGAVQEVSSSIPHYNVDYGMVITNVYFTKSAIRLAGSNRIVLWDKDKLSKRLSHTATHRKSDEVIQSRSDEFDA